MSEIISYMVLMFVSCVIFYIIVIRPGRSKETARYRFVKSLIGGEIVVVGGGVYAKVVSIDGDIIELEFSDGVRIFANQRFIRHAADDIFCQKMAREQENKNKHVDI